MTLALCVSICLPCSSALGAAGQPNPTAPEVSSDNLPEPDSGPERLKEQSRVIVETNAPVEVKGAETNIAPTALDWHLNWEDWDGLHLELRRRTLLGQQVTAVTNMRTFHLEETRMTAKIGAKVAVDAAAFLTDDDFTGFENGAELRRARLYAKGDCLILLPVSYEIEIGYVPGSFYIEDSYLKFHNLGFLGTLKGGQFQVPMSLVNYGSSRNMMFMEPATPLQALAPGVNAGFQVGRPVLEERMTWALGLFTDSVGSDFGDATKGFGRLVGRVTGLPLYQINPETPSDQHLLHLGMSGSILYAGESTVRYQSRPESHLAPFVVDTEEIPADGAYAGGLEVAWVRGPLCLQGEYLHVWVREDTGQDVSFKGFYISASWLLTGESRPYDRSTGTFGRLSPHRNFNPRKGSWGAWEITGRFSHLDLNSEDVSGGRITMLMLGINWYLHSHVKCRFDYGFGSVDGTTPDGNLNIFQTRLEVDF